MPPPRRTLAALPLLVALALASTAHAVDTGERAPALALSDLEGQTVRLEALRGKVVLVDFWATWCAPCLEELPFLQRLHERHREAGLVVLAVSVDDDASNVRRFVQRQGLTMPVLHDRGKEVVGRWAPPNMPTSYVVDRRGVVRHVNRGFRSDDAEAIARQVEALLAEQP